MARNEQDCARQKSGNKFSETSLGLLCTRGTVVVNLCTRIAVFSAASDGATAERQIQYARFRQFRIEE